MREIVVDIFAGGGGASLGIWQALGVDVDIAINHDPQALMMHQANHPHTRHECSDVWEVDPVQVTGGRPVGLAWFSPDCRHHSRAKGGKPRSKKIRSLAWVVIQWAAAVRPRVIILENVCEFAEWGPLNKKGKPIQRRKGETYHLWHDQLEALGYQVQARTMRACDYGAPTIRQRLFVIARCDGQPIVWPAPTHGGPGNLFGLPAYRTAADCIDWALPCPSIFERKKPLAEATMRRIAKGIWKYVINTREPFIVTCNHSGPEFRGQSLSEPFRTITGARDAHGLCIPLVTAIDHQGSGGAAVWPGDEPVRTITQENRFALVAAFLQKYFGGVVGADVREPMPTVTAVDHNSLVISHLTKFYGTNVGSDMREPVPTITGGGQHVGEVRAFLLKYYQCGIGQSLSDPMHTVTAKDRLGLVTVQGQPYHIADIGLRMLTPRELARAQGFPDSYILTGSKSSQVSKIGNSVAPAIARAIVAANVRLREIETSNEEVA